MSLPDVSLLVPFGVRIDGDEHSRISDLPAPTLRDLVRIHRLVVLRGFTAPQDQDELLRWCEQWGVIAASPLGPARDFVENAATVHPLSGTSAVPFHWDGMYAPHVPEFQLVQCLRADPDEPGGIGLFCDAVGVLEDLAPDVLRRWERVTITYRIENTPSEGGRAVSPLIEEHPRSGFPTLRYCEPRGPDPSGARPMRHEFDGVEAHEVPGLIDELRRLLHDSPRTQRVRWREGDVVIVDNHSLLHGYSAMRGRSPRQLRRVHVLGSPPWMNPAVRPDTTG